MECSTVDCVTSSLVEARLKAVSFTQLKVLLANSPHLSYWFEEFTVYSLPPLYRVLKTVPALNTVHSCTLYLHCTLYLICTLYLHCTLYVNRKCTV